MLRLREKILLTISLLFISFNGYAALPAGTVWEVRTAGSSSSGGCYVTGSSGTDYSQQDSAQISRTDLVIGNPTTTTLTSAGTPFTTAEIGNCIQITAGTNFTTGFYHISAVDGSNIATVDRSVGTAGATGGTGAVGGALSTIDAAVDNAVSGNDVYVKSGTYNEAVSVGSNFSGGNGDPNRLIGYVTSRLTRPTGTDRPLIDCQSTRATGLTLTAATNAVIENFRVANCTSDGIVQANSTATNLFVNVKSSSNSGAGFDLNQNGTLIGCEAGSNTTEGFDYTNDRANSILYSYSHDNSSEGFGDGSAQGAMTLVLGSISDTNTSHGFSFATQTSNFLVNNISYNNTGATTDGFIEAIASNSNVRVGIFLNNSSVSNGRYGYHLSGGTDVTHYFNYNSYYNNATAGTQNINTGDADKTGDPLFTNAGSADFTLQSSSPLEDAGINVTTYIDSLTGDYHWNIGASQDDTQSGGGTNSNGAISVGY